MKKYDKYKESNINWVGLIPNRWKVSRAKYVAEFANGVAIKDEELSKTNGDLLFLRTNDIYEGTSIEKDKRYINGNKEEYTYKEIGEFIILFDGFNKQVKKGTVGYSTFKGEGVISSDIWKIKSKGDNVKRFIEYYLMSNYVENFIVSNARGTTAQHAGHCKRDINIVIPQISEQILIAKYLDQKTSQIDAIIEKKKELIKKLKEYRQSLITEVVTKGLDLNTKMKDSGIEWIGEVPESWKISKIKSMSKVKRGASPRPIDNPEYFDENGEYSWVRISDITKSNKYLNVTTQKLSKLGSSKSLKLDKETLIISIAATVGVPIINKIKCCIHDGFICLPDLDELHKEFLYYVFLSGECYKGLGKLGTQLNLNSDTIGEIKVPFPNYEDIEKTIVFLRDKSNKINSIIKKEENELITIIKYKSSLISEVVTGKVKIEETDIK